MVKIVTQLATPHSPADIMALCGKCLSVGLCSYTCVCGMRRHNGVYQTLESDIDFSHCMLKSSLTKAVMEFRSLSDILIRS